METMLIRGFVLMLALTGFGATSVSRNPGIAKTNAPKAMDGITPPACPWNSPNACGID
jgi:hypothetical protein